MPNPTTPTDAELDRLAWHAQHAVDVFCQDSEIVERNQAVLSLIAVYREAQAKAERWDRVNEAVEKLGPVCEKSMFERIQLRPDPHESLQWEMSAYDAFLPVRVCADTWDAALIAAAQEIDHATD